MPVKPAVHVSVIGRPKSGKTTIMKLLIEALQSKGVEVDTNWGPDGEPLSVPPELEKRRVSTFNNKSKVVLSEVFRRRGHPSSEESDVIIEVKYDEEKGYGVRLAIAGFPFESWLGKLPTSKERARTIASRLEAEFDVQYYDDLPREYDWVQPQ